MGSQNSFATPSRFASGYEDRTEEVPNFSPHAFLLKHISFDGGEFYGLADFLRGVFGVSNTIEMFCEADLRSDLLAGTNGFTQSWEATFVKLLLQVIKRISGYLQDDLAIVLSFPHQRVGSLSLCERKDFANHWLQFARIQPLR